MGKYWLRIALGAGAIFAVGMLIVTLAGRAKGAVERMVASDDPITIPLGFVPFQVNGQRVGTIRSLTLIRDDTQHLEQVRLAVRLGDRADAEALPSCDLYVANPSQIDDRTTFACADSAAVASGALQALGTITLSPGDRRFRLLVDSAAATAFRAETLGTLTDASPSDAASAGVGSEVARGIRDGLADGTGSSGLVVGDSGEVVRWQADSQGFRLSVTGSSGERVAIAAGPGGVQVQSVGDRETAKIANAYADAKASAAAARARGDQRAAARAEDRAADVLNDMNDFTTAQFTLAIGVTTTVAGPEAALPIRNRMSERAAANDAKSKKS